MSHPKNNSIKFIGGDNYEHSGIGDMRIDKRVQPGKELWFKWWMGVLIIPAILIIAGLALEYYGFMNWVK